ncbi:MAG: IS21 family transposase, partial [Anaerolineae bacterium]|nr:IS21 family transposase [Anaerolineae bacterium]
WQEYRAEHPEGYSYSQFCYHFQVWRGTSQLTMHMTHKAGDKMFADFTGKKLHIVDKLTGEIKDVETFVAILGASQYTYVEAIASQKKEDWLKANQNAFYYFGGVPHAVVPDCLKAAVKQANWYEPEINPEFLEFSRHYQTAILPARPAHPKDKALVEGAVRIVYSWIFAALRDRLFHSVEELNEAIRHELAPYNAKPMQKLKVSRKQLFDQIEKSALKPLPAEKYVLRKFKRLTAQFNYHVYLSEDRHYYSVPYRYRGKQVVVFYTDAIVEMFYKNQRLACHPRKRFTPGYSTIKEHMPARHQAMSDWNPQRLIHWAQNLGTPVARVIEQVLAECQHPEQGYRACLGILRLAKKFNQQRLNKACQRAIDFHHYSYKGIKNILENGVEDCQMDLFEPLPSHENIRGNHYYQ